MLQVWNFQTAIFLYFYNNVLLVPSWCITPSYNGYLFMFFCISYRVFISRQKFRCFTSQIFGVVAQKVYFEVKFKLEIDEAVILWDVFSPSIWQL